MEILQLFLNYFLLISGFLVFFSSNPVHSVLFLIISFCNAACLLFLLNADFLGFLFIIIYVGAIAVLFLFVVMMLTVKVYSFSYLSYLPMILIISIALFFQLFFFSELAFFEALNSIAVTFTQLDIVTNIDIFGQALYNYFILCVLLAGLLLLVAMIGAIVLTLNFYSPRKTEISSKQLSRSDKFLAFLETDNSNSNPTFKH